MLKLILRILGVILFIIATIAMIGAGWIISLFFLALSIAFFIIAAFCHVANTAAFAIFGQGKSIDAIIIEYHPILTSRSDILRDHLIEDDMLLSTLKEEISIDKFKYLDHKNKTGDLKPYFHELDKTKQSFLRNSILFYTQKNDALLPNYYIDSFARSIINLFSMLVMLGIANFKATIDKNIESLDSSEYKYHYYLMFKHLLEKDSGATLILIVFRLLLASIILNLDHLKHFNHAMLMLKQHEQQYWTKDLYINRINELSDSLKDIEIHFPQAVALTTIQYYNFLADDEIDDPQNLTTDRFVQQPGNDQPYKQMIENYFTQLIELAVISNAVNN